MFYHCDLCALIVLNTYALWRRKDVVTQETFLTCLQLLLKGRPFLLLDWSRFSMFKLNSHLFFTSMCKKTNTISNRLYSVTFLSLTVFSSGWLKVSCCKWNLMLRTSPSDIMLFLVPLWPFCLSNVFHPTLLNVKGFPQRFLILSNILLQKHIQPLNCLLECLTSRKDLFTLVYLIVQRFCK